MSPSWVDALEVRAAAPAASERWPPDAPAVVPGGPGPASATRHELRAGLAHSRRLIVRLARRVDGHELDECPLDHPLVGWLSCGEWLLFADVHDVMHLEQLHRLASGRTAGAR